MFYLIGNGSVADAAFFLVGEPQVGSFSLDQIVLYCEKIHL